MITLLTALLICTPAYCSETDIDNMSLEELKQAYRELEEKYNELAGVETEPGMSAEGSAFRMSILDVATEASITSFGDKITPESGKSFLLVKLEMENISTEDQRINWHHFDTYLDGRTIDVDHDFAFSDNDLLNGNLRDGKIMEGSLCYQVPADWEELEINYREGYGGEIITVIITPSDF